MANYYASLTRALREDEVPKGISSLEDFTRYYKPAESLTTYSRGNWLSWAIERCASAYELQGICYLTAPAAVLSPLEVVRVAGQLESLLQGITLAPGKLIELLQQDAWSEEELRAVLQSPASPWDPLRESDDGDDPPYLLSFLCAHLALLQYAIERNLYVVFARTPD